MFATKFGPEIMDVSNSDFKYIQKIDGSLYTNPHQYFTSEREFLIGAILGKLDPELAFQFLTLQDSFRIKESGSKLKTKSQKICFIQQCAEQLEKLVYDSTQLQRTFSRRKLLNTKFHFSKHQMYHLLKPLIYHPDLEDMIMKIVNKCLICTIAAPKRVGTLISAQRSNIYTPSQCLVVYSCYLPKSQY